MWNCKKFGVRVRTVADFDGLRLGGFLWFVESDFFAFTVILDGTMISGRTFRVSTES